MQHFDLSVIGFRDRRLAHVAELCFVLGRHGVRRGHKLLDILRASHAGCLRAARRSRANGGYLIAGENHGRPVFKHSTESLFIYYWDGRDGGEWQGWWLGPHVGDYQVWSFNGPSEALLPPRSGWRVPWNGAPDKAVRVHVRSLAQAPASSDASGDRGRVGRSLMDDMGAIMDRSSSTGSSASESSALQCSVCFEPLWANSPSVFMTNGKRLCRHAFCSCCAGRLHKACGGQLSWAASLQCPLCRAKGIALVERLPDLRAEPERWLAMCDVDGDGALSKSELAHGLACMLPASVESLVEAFKDDLWESWCCDDADTVAQRTLHPADLRRVGPDVILAAGVAAVTDLECRRDVILNDGGAQFA